MHRKPLRQRCSWIYSLNVRLLARADVAPSLCETWDCALLLLKDRNSSAADTCLPIQTRGACVFTQSHSLISANIETLQSRTTAKVSLPSRTTALAVR